MRADRLIALLMLLQTHGRMTAEALAVELEVSLRTIYRDVTALSTAGVPVYTDRGPGGGIALLESYRTTLTGINEEEAKALFMLSVPEALVELGVSQELKAALLKLGVALQQNQKLAAIRAQQRIYLDSTDWAPTAKAGDQLETIHRAVWQDKLLKIVFKGSFDAQIEIEIAPLGLVSKMNTWYLVGESCDHLKVIKVKDIIDTKVLEQSFHRDPSFNLAEIWKNWCKDQRNRQPIYAVKVRVAPHMINVISFYMGEEGNISLGGEELVEIDGWREASIIFNNFFRARESILSMGRAIEVLEPEALRLSVIDYAEQIVDFYHDRSGILIDREPE